jgi:hypothetical protein
MRLTYHLGCNNLFHECSAAGAAPPIESTPVGGIGDSAVLLRIPVDDQMLVSLRVQRGDDVYAFNGADAPETPDRLLTLAKAVLGSGF